MSDIEKRKKSILDRLGKESLQILRDSGLDIDSAVTRILEKQQREQENLETQREFATINDIMTSELVYRSTTPEDVFGKEYTRRIRLIGLSDDQINRLYQMESLILSSEGLSEQRKQPWVGRYFIYPGLTVESLPTVGEMTLSELILITDDANSAIVRDHHVLEGEAWQAACIAGCNKAYTEARYANGFKNRVKELGWSETQESAYARNECLLTERLKWGYTDKPAWTKETTDLKQCER